MVPDVASTDTQVPRSNAQDGDEPIPAQRQRRGPRYLRAYRPVRKSRPLRGHDITPFMGRLRGKNVGNRRILYMAGSGFEVGWDKWRRAFLTWLVWRTPLLSASRQLCLPGS